MGRDVPALVFTREDRRRYRDKMHTCLDVLAQMLREFGFESERPQVGLEIPDPQPPAPPARICPNVRPTSRTPGREISSTANGQPWPQRLEVVPYGA
ncbi:hypothetical protein ABZT04_13220 [Streptomyces sp. NPDC005492]|uniref:hypothetical protein n=1 Tax=Streptomyces sp. NPDC005492 TaxID=3156883 RepID=UPI0033B8D0CB